jgi:hypothetical protein
MEHEMNAWEASTFHLIQTHLAAAVPPLIIELILQGGPTDFDYKRAREHGRYIAEHGDAIMFYKIGQSSEAMTRLVEGLAVLSFAPLGVRIFGLWFDASKIAARLGRDQDMQQEQEVD